MMKLKTNKTLTKDHEKKWKIKRIRTKIKQKHMRNYNWRTKLKTNKNLIKEIRKKIKKISNEWQLKLKYQKLRGQLCTYPSRREKRKKKKDIATYNKPSIIHRYTSY